MRTLLLDLKAYTADNNSRRNILSMRSATSGKYSRSDVLTFVAEMPEDELVPVTQDNTITVITTSGPLIVKLSTPYGVVTLPAVNGALVFPAYVSEIRIRNAGLSAVDVIIIQQ